MQIVIDISDRIYKMICNNHRMGVIDCGIIHDAIAKGTPIPKGHGRLIDADELDVTTITTDDYSGNGVLDVVLKEDIDDAPIIIEADKAESEG